MNSECYNSHQPENKSSEIRDIFHMINSKKPRNHKKRGSRTRDRLANQIWLENEAINKEYDKEVEL